MALKDKWVDKVDSPNYNHSAEDINLVANELIETQENAISKSKLDAIINSLKGVV